MLRTSLVAAVALCTIAACSDGNRSMSGASYPPLTYDRSSGYQGPDPECANAQDGGRDTAPSARKYDTLRCHELGY